MTTRCATCGRAHEAHQLDVDGESLCCPDGSGHWTPTLGKWEVIGPVECPIVFRRTLVETRFGKVLLHRFVPGAADRDPHDHPSAFLTIVLRGGYDDVQPCECRGTGAIRDGIFVRTCERGPACDGRIVDKVRAVSWRYRPATHTHTTIVGPRGAITVVVMGPKRRPWGFHRDGKWWPWKVYDRTFGHGGFRCPD